MTHGARLRVLVVDDSATVRKVLSDALRAEPDLEVAGVAADPFEARELILTCRPDVVTLALEVPRMDGLTFLRRLMRHYPMPVIVVSALTPPGSPLGRQALHAGAAAVIAKPNGVHDIGPIIDRIKASIRAAGRTLRPVGPISLQPTTARPGTAARLHGLIVIGASTGGTQAIESVLMRLPPDMPPIVVVQHMPAHFTRPFAERLDTLCPMRVAEAAGGEIPTRGYAYIAPGDRHLVVERMDGRLRLVLQNGLPVHHQRPAVDVLFHSVAELGGLPRVGVLLTGMGADGADGMVALKASGAETIAQDQTSCVVFGMPKEAIERGGAMRIASLSRMPAAVLDALDRLNRRAA